MSVSLQRWRGVSASADANSYGFPAVTSASKAIVTRRFCHMLMKHDNPVRAADILGTLELLVDNKKLFAARGKVCHPSSGSHACGAL
jgi:hypothetical protein